ncbi:MAG: sugar ABC transporter permease [Rhodospirillaceae bacterium]|nr:sugar ABC transporter permease [Rhodospirillaceae bacterium]
MIAGQIAAAGRLAPPRRRPLPARWATWPAVGYLVLVTQVPFAVTLYLSAHSWNLLYPARGVRFVGLRNYADLLGDVVFRTAVLNTVVFTVVTVAATTLFGLGLALLLDRAGFGRRLAHLLLLAPFLVMETVSPIIWKNMLLNPVYGLLNWLLGVFGIAGVDPVGQQPALTILTIVVWQWTPFMMLVLLAGLQSLPGEQRDTAAIDGAGPLQVFRHVILPHLKPFLAVGMILEAILLLPMFGPIYVTTYGGPGFATTNLTFEVYRLLTQQYEIGKAAAAGVVTAAMTIAAILLLRRVLRPAMERR